MSSWKLKSFKLYILKLLKIWYSYALIVLCLYLIQTYNIHNSCGRLIHTQKNIHKLLSAHILRCCMYAIYKSTYNNIRINKVSGSRGLWPFCKLRFLCVARLYAYVFVYKMFIGACLSVLRNSLYIFLLYKFKTKKHNLSKGKRETQRGSTMCERCNWSYIKLENLCLKIDSYSLIFFFQIKKNSIK